MTNRHADREVVPMASQPEGAELDAFAHHRALRDDPRLTTGQYAFLTACVTRADSRTDSTRRRPRGGTQAGRVRASLSQLARDAKLDADTVSAWLRAGSPTYAAAIGDHLEAVQRPSIRRVQLWLPLKPRVSYKDGVLVCARAPITHNQRTAIGHPSDVSPEELPT